MKVLIVGSGNEYAIERHFLKFMNDSSNENVVSIFRAQDIFFQYYNRHVFNKVLFRLGYKTIYKKINRRLKEVIIADCPEVLFVFKGMEVLPDTLYWAKKRGVFLVNFNPDNPFFFSGRGSGNSNVTASIGLFDLHFTYDEKIAHQLKCTVKVPVKYLPFGYNAEEVLQDDINDLNEIKKLCFVGNPDKFRAAFISQLAENGIAIDVYGDRWRKYVSHKNISVFKAVYGAEFWRILRSYRIQLNLMRPHNPASHNMRTFEVPGAGGILLAPDTPDHRKYFTVGKEVFLYDGIEDCVNQAKKILALSDNESLKIRKRAMERSQGSGYSYKDRSRFVLKSVNKGVRCRSEK